MTGDFYRSIQYPEYRPRQRRQSQWHARRARRLIGLAGPNTKIVPGHGPVVSRAEVIAHRDMILAIRDKVSQLVSQGKTQDEVLAAHPTADLRREGSQFQGNHGTFRHAALRRTEAGEVDRRFARHTNSPEEELARETRNVCSGSMYFAARGGRGRGAGSHAACSKRQDDRSAKEGLRRSDVGPARRGRSGGALCSASPQPRVDEPSAKDRRVSSLPQHHWAKAHRVRHSIDRAANGRSNTSTTCIR